MLIALLFLILFTLATEYKKQGFKFSLVIAILTFSIGIIIYYYTRYMLLILMEVFIACQLLYYCKKQQISYFIFILQMLVTVMIIYLGYKTQQLCFAGWQLFVVFVTIRIYDFHLLNIFENSSTRFQNKLLENQVEEVNHIYLTMREWRHDYHNHLQSLKVKLAQNQIEKSIQYLNELENELSDIRQIVESNNLNIDAILNSKLSLAISHNIDVNVKVLIPDILPLKDIDCCVLLGNLLDNAIESCDKVEKNKFIRLYIGLYKKQLYISITNSTNEIVRKYDDEYITMKRGNHGHGLKRINKVVERYNGYVNRKNEPGVFATEIMLPMNQKGTK